MLAKRAKPGLFYDFRLSVGFNVVLPTLILPIMGAFNALTWQSNGIIPPLNLLIRPFETVLPLAAGLAAAHLLTLEHDERFADLRRTYPEPRWRLPLARLVVALVMTLVILIAGGIVYFGAYPSTDVGAALRPAFAPTLFMIGLSMAVGAASRSYWAAAGVVMVYWFLEMQTRGAVTGVFYLFRRSLTTPEIESVPYDLNRLLVAGVGLALIGVMFALHSRRRAH